MLEKDPPHGVCAWPFEDKLNQLEAQIEGPEDSPYRGGVFKLKVDIPDRYPFEPPKIRFVTPIYHPNIDNGGRICLDTLKMPPKGSWGPQINLSTVLATIRLLMATPNPQDGLMAEITEQFLNDRRRFDETARALTAKHAKAASVIPKSAAAPQGSGTGGSDDSKAPRPPVQSTTAAPPRAAGAKRGTSNMDGSSRTDATDPDAHPPPKKKKKTSRFSLRSTKADT